MFALRTRKAFASQKGFSVLEIALSLVVLFVAVAVGMSVMASFNRGMLRTETQFNVLSLHETVLKSSRSPANTGVLALEIENTYPNLKECLEGRGVNCNSFGVLALATSVGSLGVVENFNRVGAACASGTLGCSGEQSVSLAPLCSSSTDCDSVKLVIDTKFAGVAGTFQYQSDMTYDPFAFGWVRAAGSCTGRMLAGYDRATGKPLCVNQVGSKCERVGWYAPSAGPVNEDCQDIAQAPQSIDRGIGEPTSFAVVGYRPINGALLPPTIPTFEGGVIQNCAQYTLDNVYLNAGTGASRTLTCPGGSTFRFRNEPTTWGVWGSSPGWAGSQVPIGAAWGSARQMVYNLYYGGMWGPTIIASLSDNCCTNMSEPAILSVIRGSSLRRYYKYDVVGGKLLASEYRNIENPNQYGYDVDIVDNTGTLFRRITKNMSEAEFVVSDIAFRVVRSGEPTVLVSDASADHTTRAQYVVGSDAQSVSYQISNFIQIDPNVLPNTSDLHMGYVLRMNIDNTARVGIYNSSCNLEDYPLTFTRGNWAELRAEYRVDVSFTAAGGGANHFDLGGLNCMNSGPIDPEQKSMRKHIVYDLLKRIVVRSVHVESGLNNWGYDVDLVGANGAVLRTVSGNYANQEAFFNSALSVSSEKVQNSSTVQATSNTQATPSSVSGLNNLSYSILNYVYLSPGSTTPDPNLVASYQYDIQPDDTVKFYFRTDLGTPVLASSSLMKDTWVKLTTDFLVHIRNN